MSPREDGSFLVPEPIVKLWKDVANGGRDEVKKLWMTVGGDKDLNCNHGTLHEFLFNSSTCVVPWAFQSLDLCHPFPGAIRSEMQEAVWVHFRAGLVGGWSLHEWEGYARWGVWRVIWRIHCMHACYLYTNSWNRHFTIYCTYNLQIVPTISRSRIAAIKSECKKNTGWIRLLRCNQLRQACKPTCLLQCVCFSESFLSTVASGEIGMKSTFKSFGWRINWLAGVWLLLALSPIFKTSKSSILYLPCKTIDRINVC